VCFRINRCKHLETHQYVVHCRGGGRCYMRTTWVLVQSWSISTLLSFHLTQLYTFTALHLSGKYCTFYCTLIWHFFVPLFSSENQFSPNVVIFLFDLSWWTDGPSGPLRTSTLSYFLSWLVTKVFFWLIGAALLSSYILWICAIFHLRGNRSVYTDLKTGIPLRPHKLALFSPPFYFGRFTPSHVTIHKTKQKLH